MKVSTTILLLVAGSFCLFQGCSARVEPIPLKFPAKLGDEEKAEPHYEEIMPVDVPISPYYEDIMPVDVPISPYYEDIMPVNVPIEPRHVPIEPRHVPIQPRYEEIMPVKVPIEPRHVPIEPRHVPIQPRYEEIMPVEVPIEPRYEEIMPVKVPIEPRYEDIMPVEVPIEPRHVPIEPRDVPIQPRYEDIMPVDVPFVPYEPREDIIEPAVVPEGRAGECKVTIRGGLGDPQPVFIKDGTNEFYPFSDTGVMVVDSGKTLEMFCPSQFKSIAKTLVTASCVSGSTFKVDGTSYSIKELTCKSWPGFVAKKTGASCNGGVMIRVGFEVSSSRFLQQMQVCFNEGEEVTRYVQYTLDPGSNYYQTGVDRITFQTAGFFGGKNVDNLYTQNTQKQTINSHLGGDADKYFDSSKNVYLARGHMAAKADFVYGTQQRATFLFINAAPQWQVFNAGNWARVEDGVRAHVSKNKLTVECYTGVWGVTTLPNNKGVQTPLYLAYDNNNNGLIPVPKLYFRVVIDKATKKGIVFLGVNNPHLSMDEIKKDYIICPDVGDRVNYINWKKTDIMAGYSYACEVGEFTKVVKHLPSLSAPGGLLL